MAQPRFIAFPEKEKKPIMKAYRSVMISEQKAQEIADALNTVTPDQIPKLLAFQRNDDAFEVRFLCKNIPLNTHEIKEHFGIDILDTIKNWKTSFVPKYTSVKLEHFKIIRDELVTGVEW